MSEPEPDDSEPVAPIDPTDTIQSQLDRARARHGTLGAVVFSAMLGVDKVLEMLHEAKLCGQLDSARLPRWPIFRMKIAQC